MNGLALANKETMTSIQLSEMFGYEAKEINKKIRAMFGEDKAREEFSPALDGQARVMFYNLPELESKMFVAKHDITYLEKITQYWIDQTSKKQLPEDYPAALRALADREEQLQIAIDTKAEIGSRREATSMNTASQAVRKSNKLEIELDKSKEYCTVKRMQMICHGQKFDWRLLKSTANEMETTSIDVFDSNYGTVKSYHKSVWLETYGIEV